MSAYLALAPCFACGRRTGFNPELAPSVTICLDCKRPLDLHEDNCPRTGETSRFPLCQDCVEYANELRARDGLPLITVLPGAYGPQVNR